MSLYDRVFKPRTYTLSDGTVVKEKRSRAPIIILIVVALAGIAGYTLPNQELSNAVRLLRLGLVLAAALAGLFGILAALGLVIWYLCTIESDGVAYMAPFVDSERPTIFRTLLRRPQPDEKFRPPEYGSPNRRQQR